MPEGFRLERILKRDRAVVLTGLGAAILLAWLYILLGAGMRMHGRDAIVMMQPAAWTPGYAALMLAMWWTMMVAMMLPGATPMILLFAGFNRRQRDKGRPFVATGAFVSGYLMIWGGFSAVAVALQLLFGKLGLLSPAMAATGSVLGGGLLLAAGIWQLTPLKHACLRHCRSPLHFMAERWRAGRLGAAVMGLQHGAFCLGCCWLLMALLFYGGVMNLYWIVGLAVFVLVEKLGPAGPRLGWIGGAGLILWGGTVLASSLAG